MAEDFENRHASRRGFFREAFAGLLAPLVELLEEQLDLGGQRQPIDRPPLRPPGAAPGEAFSRRCTLCGDCAGACPVGAIVLDPLPRIEPARQPCVLCEDLPCVSACATSALESTRVGEVGMGLAVWDPQSCLLSSGRPCSACVGACPVAGAIRIEAGAVVVDGGLCTGCGMCEHHCPAEPAALTVEPF